jgi:dTDP-4-dehydrorhamnose 3,5-epimerase
MKHIEPLMLQGAAVLTLPTSHDNRGQFVKTFHQTLLKDAGIDFTLRESYYSFSKKDVIRGMHFQTPPHQHAKIVFCPKGAITDVIVDLRKNSPTYGQFAVCELSESNNKAMYVPEGFAHGFKSLTDGAMTYYLVSSEYCNTHDTGIHYDSIGFDWGVIAPILSTRDAGFVKLCDWQPVF